VFGVIDKTIHHWKRLAGAYGLHALLAKEHHAPATPNPDAELDRANVGGLPTASPSSLLREQ
jgi:hypothetical protein